MDHIGRAFYKYMNNPEISQRYKGMIDTIMKDADVQAFFQKHEERLSREIVERSYSKLHEYVQEKEKIRLGKESQNPGYEPNLVLNAGYIDVVYTPTDETMAREKEKELRSRVHSMSMPKDVRTATLERFVQSNERMPAILESLNFIDSFNGNPKVHHQALYFYGPFGVGKSYLLGAIAHELAMGGHLTTLMHYPTFTMEMKQAIQSNTVNEKIDAVKKAEILMLDDIGAEANSTWIRDEVLGVILQYRMQEDLPTFFSSNFTMQQLEEHLRMGNRGDDEPMKAKRLMERIRFLSREIPMTGKNRRFEQ